MTKEYLEGAVKQAEEVYKFALDLPIDRPDFIGRLAALLGYLQGGLHYEEMMEGKK